MSLSPVLIRNVIVCLAVFNVCLLLIRSRLGADKDEYTYKGYDFPPHLPLPPLNTVNLILEESSTFTVSNATLNNWWDNLSADLGYARLGPSSRIFAVSMAHQQHCLQRIAAALVVPRPRNLSQGEEGHLQHCLNYIRQNVLCEADATIEPAPFWMGNEDRKEVKPTGENVDLGVQRTYGVRKCRDWRVVYSFVEKNFADWLHMKERVFSGHQSSRSH